MARDQEIVSLSRSAAALARWRPGSRAEKLARLASLDAQAARHREQAEQLDAVIATELAALDGQDGRA